MREELNDPRDFENDISIRKSNESRLLTRSCENLLGICNGLMADGILNDKEIHFLDTWLADHTELIGTWPGGIVYYRVSEVLADGVITQEERTYLENTLRDLLGGTIEDSGAAEGLATRLPLNDIDSMSIDGSQFCFTGTFMFGTRASCVRATERRGGIVNNKVTRDLDYLIIGSMSTHSWANTSFGRKIEKAVEYQQQGLPLLIVSEELWVEHLDGEA